MHAFDRERQSELMSLVEIDAVLHFPFFANTFSLPFHYANKLNDGNRTLLNAKEHLMEHKWELDFPALVEDRVNVFYSTTASREKFEASPECEQWNIFGKGFTHYKARFLFTEPRMIFRDSKEFSDDFVYLVVNQSVTRIELLTDIPIQSEMIRQYLVRWGFKGTIDTICQPIDALFSVDPSEKCLKLYFYGAPTTTHMRHHPARYFALEVPDRLLSFDKRSTTEICIATPKHLCIPVEVCESILSELKTYHDVIFETARVDPRKLLSIWWAYNQYAERKQHSAIFPDSGSFAKCLIDHHRSV